MWHNDALDAHAHLFEAQALRDAGVDEPADHADAPVESVCNATSSYGPFYPVGYARSYEDLYESDDVCRRCIRRWDAKIDDYLADDDDEGEAPNTED